MKYISFIFIFLLFSFGFLGISSAQTIGGGDNDLLIEFIPEVPREGELVNVSVRSYSSNIDLAKFTWRVNGKTIKTGVGEKNFNFNMGKIGERVTVDLLIQDPSGNTINKFFSFFPKSVELIYQSNGYVPPFYKGKTLFAHQNTVSVIAVPYITNQNGIEVNPKNMIYKWRKNGSVVENASGYGRNVYTFEGSLISRDLNISVEVSAGDNGVAYGNLRLNPTEPFIVFYKKDPLYGIEFQRRLVGNEDFKGSNEISIISAPFFYESSEYKNNYLVYNWSINGKKIEGNGSPVQVFRQKEGTSGTSKISLTVESPSRPLQFSSQLLDLTFKSNQ